VSEKDKKQKKYKPRRQRKNRERSVPPAVLLARYWDGALFTIVEARGKRFVVTKGTITNVVMSAVTTSEGRCGYGKGDDDECRRWVGFMLCQGRGNPASPDAYRYCWWGFQRGQYVDAPTGPGQFAVSRRGPRRQENPRPAGAGSANPGFHAESGDYHSVRERTPAVKPQTWPVPLSGF
jgi:hypothetical protein